MPVDSPDQLYAERLPQWQRCRDARAGSDAIKNKGVIYLPAPSGFQNDPLQYAAYKTRAMFYAATERTVEGMTGLVLRRDPVIEVPPEVEADMEDITLACQSFDSLLLEILDDCITVGRLGLLIEYPKAEEDSVRPTTDRPYWTLYRAEQIVSWTVGKVLDPDGVQRTGLTRVVLLESVTVPDATDRFVNKTIAQARVLEILDGQYTVTLWQRRPDVTKPSLTSSDWVITTATTAPVRKNQPLPAIPFVFIGSRHTKPVPDKPPLLDMVDVNLSHYRSSADLEHGRHWTALPTPWVTGYSGTTKLNIGSTVAWALANAEAKVGMLEFSGQGLGALEKALDQKEKTMAVLGSRLLEIQPGQRETAEVVRLRHAGDAATLTSITTAIDAGLTKAFQWHAYWLGHDDAFTADLVSVSLNKDFFETPMDAPTSLALLQAWQAGAISWKTYFYMLQQGEWMRPDATAEDEQAAIKADAAMHPAPEPPAAPASGNGHSPAGVPAGATDYSA